MVKVTAYDVKPSTIRMKTVKVYLYNNQGIVEKQSDIMVSDTDKFLVGQCQTIFPDCWESVVKQIRELYPVGYITQLLKEREEQQESAEYDKPIMKKFNPTDFLSQSDIDRETELLRSKVKKKDLRDRYGNPIDLNDIWK